MAQPTNRQQMFQSAPEPSRDQRFNLLIKLLDHTPLGILNQATSFDGNWKVLGKMYFWRIYLRGRVFGIKKGPQARKRLWTSKSTFLLTNPSAYLSSGRSFLAQAIDSSREGCATYNQNESNLLYPLRPTNARTKLRTPHPGNQKFRGGLGEAFAVLLPDRHQPERKTDKGCAHAADGPERSSSCNSLWAGLGFVQSASGSDKVAQYKLSITSASKGESGELADSPNFFHA